MTIGFDNTGHFAPILLTMLLAGLLVAAYKVFRLNSAGGPSGPAVDDGWPRPGSYDPPPPKPMGTRIRDDVGGAPVEKPEEADPEHRKGVERPIGSMNGSRQPPHQAAPTDPPVNHNLPETPLSDSPALPRRSVQAVPAQPVAEGDKDSKAPASEPTAKPPVELSEPQPVEICAITPAAAIAGRPFQIEVRLSLYDPYWKNDVKALSEKGASVYKTLVIAARSGALITLDMSEKPNDLEFDSCRQDMIWPRDGRELVAVFHARIPLGKIGKTHFHAKLIVSVDHIEIGKLELAIPQSAIETKGTGRFAEKLSADQITNTAGKALVRIGNGHAALRYKTVFISHVSEDEPQVANFADPFQLAGIETYYSPTDSGPGVQHWTENAELQLRYRCDSMLVCWSQNATTSYEEARSPIRMEIDYALGLEKTHQMRLVFINIDDDPDIELPKGLSGRPWVSDGYAARLIARRHKK
jgi:hypothetical protein